MNITIRDSDTNEDVVLTVAISEEYYDELSEQEQDDLIESVTFDYYENKAAEEIERQFK
ncbi:hypothetical protein J9236_00125 [Providencia rettgeri]|uniref:hypothetical protein n=1 Tax=Providencia rettgeri TaxID=587 RepID=UPI001B3856BF|nr:hypothetical protein [Providencia rettgeri]ELM3939804.1 hypothetical protein [Providencia rettgeri]MBQ0339646.1 hypothetical protein [Providencia rettgeri]